MTAEQTALITCDNGATLSFNVMTQEDVEKKISHKKECYFRMFWINANHEAYVSGKDYNGNIAHEQLLDKEQVLLHFKNPMQWVYWRIAIGFNQWVALQKKKYVLTMWQSDSSASCIYNPQKVAVGDLFNIINSIRHGSPIEKSNQIEFSRFYEELLILPMIKQWLYDEDQWETLTIEYALQIGAANFLEKCKDKKIPVVLNQCWVDLLIDGIRHYATFQSYLNLGYFLQQVNQDKSLKQYLIDANLWKYTVEHVYKELQDCKEESVASTPEEMLKIGGKVSDIYAIVFPGVVDDINGLNLTKFQENTSIKF